jgi:hypothetical protein
VAHLDASHDSGWLKLCLGWLPATAVRVKFEGPEADGDSGTEIVSLLTSLYPTRRPMHGKLIAPFPTYRELDNTNTFRPSLHEKQLLSSKIPACSDRGRGRHPPRVPCSSSARTTRHQLTWRRSTLAFLPVGAWRSRRAFCTGKLILVRLQLQPFG